MLRCNLGSGELGTLRFIRRSTPTVRPLARVVHSVLAGSIGVAKFLLNGWIDRKACLLRNAWFKLDASRRDAIAEK
jgi:hypothetical protein